MNTYSVCSKYHYDLEIGSVDQVAFGSNAGWCYIQPAFLNRYWLPSTIFNDNHCITVYSIKPLYKERSYCLYRCKLKRFYFKKVVRSMQRSAILGSKSLTNALTQVLPNICVGIRSFKSLISTSMVHPCSLTLNCP